MTRMLTSPMLDPTGPVIVELRGDAYLSALVGTRIAQGEVPPGWAKGADAYMAFVILTGAPAPDRRVPISRTRYTARCYGATFQQAFAVWGALVQAIHMSGPRVKSNGLGIYVTAIAEDADSGKDPDTQQPFVEGTLEVIATAQAVT